MLVVDGLLHHLPLHAERRIGEAVVETLGGQQVVRERVAELEVANVIALDQLVGHADGIGLGVQFLRVGHDARVGVPLGHLLDGRRQKAAGAGRAVVHGSHHALAGEGIDARELLRNEVEQVGRLQLQQPLVEAEVLEYLAGVGRELGNVFLQVRARAGRAHRCQRELRRVVEARAGHVGQHQIKLNAGSGERREVFLHLGAGGFEHALHASQHGERQDDPAEQRGLEVASQRIGDVPDEIGEVLLVHGREVPQSDARIHRPGAPCPCRPGARPREVLFSVALTGMALTLAFSPKGTRVSS